MDLWELIARESIRDIVARYNGNGDIGCIDEMVALFSPDATLEVPGHTQLMGVNAIRAFFAGVASDGKSGFELKCLHHHTATHQIDMIDKCSAQGRCYFAVYTQQGLDHWGRYIDEYLCLENVWKFHSRQVRVDGCTPGGWGEHQISAPTES